MSQYEFKEVLLTPGEGARPGRKLINPIALVIHWTGNENKGANAIANRNYFENWRDHLNHLASAHYIVDDHQVVRCIPEDEVAYQVGAQQYQPKAVKTFAGNPNNQVIGIEMCVNYDGDFNKTYKNTIELAADILYRHGWGVDRLWRHYDVTGKTCPAYFVNDKKAKIFGYVNAAAGWDKFCLDVNIELRGRVEEVLAMFKDINGHWAKESVDRLANLGLIKGDGQGNFRPDQPITRAETVVLLDRLLKLLGK